MEMTFIMDRDDLEKFRKKEWERNPMINLSDSVNRSMFGDLNALGNGCLTKIIIFIILIGLFILSRCSY